MCCKKPKYRKFNDHQLFCEKCGTVKAVSTGYWWKPYYPTHFPYYWTINTTNATKPWSDNATYTTWNDVEGAAGSTTITTYGALKNELEKES